MVRGLGGVALAVAGLLVSGLAVADSAVFDTAGHEKVAGIRLQVAYPKDFDAKEHMDGYVIQEFTRKSGTLEENLTLQLIDVDEDEARAGFDMPGAAPLEERRLYWQKPLERLPMTKAPQISDTRAAGLPAVFLGVAMAPSDADALQYVQLQSLHVYLNGRDIILSCSVSGPNDQREAVDRLYEKSRAAVCKPFFDSLKILKDNS